MNTDVDAGMWDPTPLKARIAARRQVEARAPGVDEVVLAYARWKGRTHEIGVDREAEKATLDRLMDEIEPEQWRELKDIIGEVDDKLLVEVMRYSAERALEQNKELVREIEALDHDREVDELEPEDEPELEEPDLDDGPEPDDEPERSKRRKRSR